MLAAKKAGFTKWGFSPHGPICVDSGCNMRREDVGIYINEVRRLQILLPEMEILAGMEVDYIDENNGPSSLDVQSYHLDYVIGSVHFIPNQKGLYYDIDGSPERFIKTLHDHFEGDLEYVVKTFWNQTQLMIKAGGMDLIGHIDKIALNACCINPEIEESPEYLKMANETIEMAIESGIAIEINTKHWKKYGRFFPHPRYWLHILESGIKMPINTDTHYAECVEDGLEAATIEKQNVMSHL